MTINDAFERFLFKKQIKNLSPKTIVDYRTFCVPFISFVGASLDVAEIETALVEKYISTLYKRPLSDATRATYIRHIKAFLRWLKDCYSIPVILSEIEIPKVGKKFVRTLEEDDVKKLFACIPASPKWIHFRNCAIIALMYDSGLRQNEVATLLLADLDIENHIAIVRGKGNKERFVSVGHITMDYIQTYLEACPFTATSLFVERNGASLSTNAIKLMVQKLRKASGIDFSSHKLRHNFATNYVIDSLHATGQCDAFTLQTLLGHENIKTTEQYLHYGKNLVAAENGHSHLDTFF